MPSATVPWIARLNTTACSLTTGFDPTVPCNVLRLSLSSTYTEAWQKPSVAVISRHTRAGNPQTAFLPRFPSPTHRCRWCLESLVACLSCLFIRQYCPSPPFPPSPSPLPPTFLQCLLRPEHGCVVLHHPLHAPAHRRCGELAL